MLDLVRFLLYANYIYGRVMGVINFEIDMRTGHARISRCATLYAIFVITLFCCLVPLVLHNQIWHSIWGQLNQFHEYVFLVVMGVRILCVFITLLNRWWQRQQIVSLIESFRLIVLQQPEVMRLWRRGLISKCICGMFSELFHGIWGLYGLRSELTLGVTLSILAMSIFIALLNIVLSQYYFAMLTVHGHYILFEQEMHSILAELRSQELDRRQGVRQLRSCALADRLDNLARTQSELQSILMRMSHIFGIQTLCVAFITQFSLVAGVFYAFLTLRHNILRVYWVGWPGMLLGLGALAYMIDQHITFTIVFYVFERHANLANLLGSYTTYEHTMDVRLQMTVSVLSKCKQSNPNLASLSVRKLCAAVGQKPAKTHCHGSVHN